MRKLKWFVAIMAGHMCTIINRGRWTRADDGLDWVGILACVHNILVTVYGLWWEKVTGRKLRPRCDAAPDAAHAHAMHLMDVVAPADLGVEPDTELGGEDPNPAPAAASVEPPQDDANTANRSTEENVKDRSIGLQFVLNPALKSDTIVIKSLAQPIINMMHASLDQGGARWERLQYASAAKTGAREYRATNAAMRKLETAAMEALRTVSTNAAHWEVIPLADRSVSFRNKAFKLSSALACSLSAKHMRVHSKGPFTGFLWLGSPHGLKAEYDRHTRKQVLGSWLEAWCAYWERNGGPPAQPPTSPPRWCSCKRTWARSRRVTLASGGNSCS